MIVYFFPLQVTTQAQHLGEVLEHNGQQALPLHHILNHRLRGEEMLLLYRWFSPERTLGLLTFWVSPSSYSVCSTGAAGFISKESETIAKSVSSKKSILRSTF